MSTGASKLGSLMSITLRRGVTAAAATSTLDRSVCDTPRSVHVLMDSVRTHRPVTFLRNRIVPSTPPSLVKSANRAASVSTGASSSSPTNDQVPEEMYADASPLAGAPTAEAVSWDPTAITGPPMPREAPMSGSNGPTRSPAERSGGRIAEGTPTRSASSTAHSCARTSYIPAVEALVRSAPSLPVSQ